MMCKKDVILFMSIFCVLALISGSTFAYWGWQSETNKSVVFNTSHGIEDYFVYDEGDSHFVGDFQPSANYCSGMSNTISFYKTSEVASQTLTATINMDVNYIGSNTRSSSDVYWVITSGDSSSCTGNLSDALHYGTFNGIANGTTVTLETDVAVTTSAQTFTIWIWINSAGSDLSSLSGETIDVNVWSQIDMLEYIKKEPGLYAADGNYTSWDDLVTNGDITVSGAAITDANTSLSGELVIPDTITSISANAFYDCSSLTEISIPSSITTIGQQAFYGCSSLTEISIPSSVTAIERSTFNGCSSLNTVFLPVSITTIGQYAFAGTGGSITDVYYGGTSDDWSAITIEAGNAFLTNATIHYNS